MRMPLDRPGVLNNNKNWKRNLPAQGVSVRKQTTATKMWSLARGDSEMMRSVQKQLEIKNSQNGNNTNKSDRDEMLDHNFRVYYQKNPSIILLYRNKFHYISENPENNSKEKKHRVPMVCQGAMWKFSDIEYQPQTEIRKFLQRCLHKNVCTHIHIAVRTEN